MHAQPSACQVLLGVRFLDGLLSRPMAGLSRMQTVGQPVKIPVPGKSPLAGQTGNDSFVPDSTEAARAP